MSIPAWGKMLKKLPERLPCNSLAPQKSIPRAIFRADRFTALAFSLLSACSYFMLLCSLVGNTTPCQDLLT